MVNHSMQGVFMACGPAFKSMGTVSQTPRLVDVAPTILHLLDVQVDKDMDGVVLQNFLRTKKPVVLRQYSKYHTITIDEKSVDDKIKDRLRTLGYI
jgi:arylsulfatase A-like enzyme